MDVIAAELLREFEKEAKTKPERVVFFRDGVSEGQYQAVMRDEVPLLRKAFASLGDGPDPKLTFVIVAKRHHTRLFPTRDQDKDKKSGNVLAGTVVDTVMCGTRCVSSSAAGLTLSFHPVATRTSLISIWWRTRASRARHAPSTTTS